MTSMVPILSRALQVYKNIQYIYFKNSLTGKKQKKFMFNECLFI